MTEGIEQLWCLLASGRMANFFFAAHYILPSAAGSFVSVFCWAAHYMVNMWQIEWQIYFSVAHYVLSMWQMEWQNCLFAAHYMVKMWQMERQIVLLQLIVLLELDAATGLACAALVRLEPFVH